MAKASVTYREPDSYAECAFQLCHEECTNRYPLPFCHQHVLYIWSMVDQDMRESGRTAADVEAEKRQIQDDRAARVRAAMKADAAKRGVPGMIYYLRIGEYIKIGYTANPRRRGGEYPPGSELLLTYPGSPEDEKRLHQKFSAYREAGREWYMDAAEIREHIDEIQSQHGSFNAGMQRRTRREPGARQMRRRSGPQGHAVT